MSTILDTVESYEDQVIDFVKQAKKPGRRVRRQGRRARRRPPPRVTYPTALPTPIEVVESQAAFAKKLIDANTALVTAVLKTVAPVAGYARPRRSSRPLPRLPDHRSQGHRPCTPDPPRGSACDRAALSPPGAPLSRSALARVFEAVVVDEAAVDGHQRGCAGRR